MSALKLVLRNALRHRLRSGLTVTGLLVAVLAYGLLQTVVDAWYAGAAASSNARLVTRNAISLVFALPLSYENRIRGVEGVKTVARSSWFGGIYQEPKNFFPQFAVSDAYFSLYPEFIIPESERIAYGRDRKGTLIGRQLATASRSAMCCHCAGPSIRAPGSLSFAVFSTAPTRARSPT